jgi:hypothetical protein
VDWVASLPGRWWAILSALPGLIGDAFTGAWNAGVAVVKYQIGLTVGEVKALPGLMWSALSGLGHLLGSIWDAAWGAAVGAVKYQIGVIVFEVKKLPGMLWNLGGDIIGGLINGITGYYGRLWSLAWDLGQHFLKGFKAAFGISSPSKVMDEDIAQKGIGAGLIQGLEKTRGKVGGAAGRLAADAMGPFGQRVDAKGGAVALAGALATQGAPVHITVINHLDGKEIGNRIYLDPQRVAAATDRGRRTRGFVDTAERRGRERNAERIEQLHPGSLRRQCRLGEAARLRRLGPDRVPGRRLDR